MSFLSKVVYHFFNIIFKVLIVCAGLLILVVGINLFSANAAASANKLHLNINFEPVHLELPAFVPEKIKEPVDQVQLNFEAWLADVVNLDNATMFVDTTPSITTEAKPTDEWIATETPTLPAETQGVETTDDVLPTGTLDPTLEG